MRREEHTEVVDNDDPNTPDAKVVAFASRIAFGALAFGGTVVIGDFIGLHSEQVKEVAILNGGVAYYTHEAAGQVVVALNRVYRLIAERDRAK